MIPLLTLYIAHGSLLYEKDNVEIEVNPGDLITISHPLLERAPDVTQRDAAGKLFLSGRFEIKPDGSCYLAGTEY